MVDFPYFVLGSVLVMLGMLLLIFSLKGRDSKDTGIILLGPIPIIWSGSNKTLMIIFVIGILLLAILPWVFLS